MLPEILPDKIFAQSIGSRTVHPRLAAATVVAATTVALLELEHAIQDKIGLVLHVVDGSRIGSTKDRISIEIDVPRSAQGSHSESQAGQRLDEIFHGDSIRFDRCLYPFLTSLEHSRLRSDDASVRRSCSLMEQPWARNHQNAKIVMMR